jgi:5-methylcytosine-specific restriction protein A
MWSAARACPEPGCGKPSARGEKFCEAHVKENYLTRQVARRREHCPWLRWYDWAVWKGFHGLQGIVVRRDPVCKICNRNPSTVADHIVPHRGNWDLFTSLSNLQGLCAACHSEKTAREDGGFGNGA